MPTIGKTIGSLKRQLLELLSDSGFAPKGLRSRRVEAIGRHDGGSDGVRAGISFLKTIFTIHDIIGPEVGPEIVQSNGTSLLISPAKIMPIFSNTL